MVKKWNSPGTQAVLAWDAGGYYLYLPSFFYDDLGRLDKIGYITQKYAPFGDGPFYNAFKLPNGNHVMKYAMGQAFMFLPWFGIAHLWAKFGGYPVDGFSYPYQFSILMGCIFFAFVGLWFIRKALLKYFDDNIVAAALLILCFSSNYFNYVSYSGCLTHSNLFTLYALIIYLSIRFYEQPSMLMAIVLGLLSGLAALTRPTEVILALIPLLWGVYNKESFRSRIHFLLQNYGKVIMYTFSACAVGSIQMLYWKKYTGHYLYWSYGDDQSFSFLKPHIIDGLFSYRKGWFVYTPVMVLSIIGFVPLYKKYKGIFWPILIFTLINIYLVFSWNCWWYGGSFSQRAVIQSYALLLFPLCSFLNSLRSKTGIALAVTFVLGCTYVNMIMTYQANGPYPIMESEMMTRQFFWRTFCKTSPLTVQDKKLLDTDEELNPKNEAGLKTVFETSFESLPNCDSLFAYTGKKSVRLDKNNQQYNYLVIPVTSSNKRVWYRAYVKVFPKDLETNVWQQTQFILFLKNGSVEFKDRGIRVGHITEPGKWQEIFTDIYVPAGAKCDSINVKFWNMGSDKTIYFDDLRLARVELN